MGPLCYCTSHFCEVYFDNENILFVVLHFPRVSRYIPGSPVYFPGSLMGPGNVARSQCPTHQICLSFVYIQNNEFVMQNCYKSRIDVSPRFHFPFISRVLNSQFRPLGPLCYCTSVTSVKLILTNENILFVVLYFPRVPPYLPGSPVYFSLDPSWSPVSMPLSPDLSLFHVHTDEGDCGAQPRQANGKSSFSFPVSLTTNKHVLRFQTAWINHFCRSHHCFEKLFHSCATNLSERI